VSHDEHGRVDVEEHEHGPEWWAMDREFFCDSCGHSAYRHRERLTDSEPAPCGECACQDFELGEAD
jgi:hypothetical protein